MKHLASENFGPKMVESIEFISNTLGGGLARFEGPDFRHIEYAPNVVAINTMLRKSIGKAGLVSCDAAKNPEGSVSPFDTLAQLVKGQGEVVIEGRSHFLKHGQDILIPANHAHFIKPSGHMLMRLESL